MTQVSSLFSQLDATARPGASNTAKIAEDFNTFLNLLTVQLQNQDPLEPLDTNQFTEQIVNMTQVEQTVSMNDRLGALIDAQETQRIHSAVDFVGKQTDALGNLILLDEGGTAEMFYTLPANADNARALVIDPTINDPERRIVHDFGDISGQAGVHRLNWDGLNADGEPVDPNKVYRLDVTALTEGGQEIQTQVGFSGIAQELRNADGVLTLLVAGRHVPVDQIVAARKVADPTQPTQTEPATAAQ